VALVDIVGETGGPFLTIKSGRGENPAEPKLWTKQNVAKAEVTTMSKCFLRTKKYLLIVAICLSLCAINGCVESIFPLATDSRLPKWFTLPPGLTRADVKVELEAMEPTRRSLDIKVVLYNKKFKKLAEVRGKTIGAIMSRSFFIDVVNGIPEITGLKYQSDGHGGKDSVFYVVDDPAFKKKLLDQNGVNDPTLRKKLLDENGGTTSDH
jgi:hypothetical protein